jgi:hypothetical protein
MAMSTDTMMHFLKCWPEPFASILSGAKRFELRKYDRPFRLGDTLRLREYVNDKDIYTGRQVDMRVTYMLIGGSFGLPEGMVIMSIAPTTTEGDRR